VEKMTRQHAIEVIEGPCKVHEIEVEEGFSEALLNKLNPEANEVELTYLQVFLDKIYRLATMNDSPAGTNYDLQSKLNDDPPTGGSNDSKQFAQPSTSFTIHLLEDIGDVSDLLGSFLEEQISVLDDPDTGLAILKSFVSLKGTRKQVSEDEIKETAKTFGQNIPNESLKEHLQQFVNLRILKDKDEIGRYELRHDSLANIIYEKITLVEKELLEVRQFLENALDQFEKRKIYLTTVDLKYIAPYEEKLFLNKRTERFIEESKNILFSAKRRQRQIMSVIVLTAFIILSAFTIWAIVERSKATRALKEKEIVEERLAEAAKDFVMFPRNLNILYKGIENPVSFAIPGMPKGRLFFDSDFPMSLYTDENNMIIIPDSTGAAAIDLYRIIDNDTIKLGSRVFDVRNLPTPIPILLGKTGGFILRDSLVNMVEIKAIIPDFAYNYWFKSVKYTISFETPTFNYIQEITNNNFPEYVRSALSKTKHNSRIQFFDIIVLGADSVIRNIGSLSLTVIRWISYENSQLFTYYLDEAILKEDWARYKTIAIENIDKYYLDSYGLLNKIAYEFYLYVDDENALNKALEWAERLNRIKQDNLMYLDTYAALLFKLDRIDEAIAIQEDAIRIARSTGEPTSDLENFLRKIKNKK